MKTFSRTKITVSKGLLDVCNKLVQNRRSDQASPTISNQRGSVTSSLIHPTQLFLKKIISSSLTAIGDFVKIEYETEAFTLVKGMVLVKCLFISGLYGVIKTNQIYFLNSRVSD